MIAIVTAPPLLLTTARWKNRKGTHRMPDGTVTERWSKVLAHQGSYQQFRYGCDHPSDWDGPLQMCIICSPWSGVIAVDVDNESAYLTTRTVQLVTREQAISVRGPWHWHALIDARSIPPGQWPSQGPIAGADVKSCGFIPVPGSQHYSGEKYELPPGGTVRPIIPATPELIEAMAADRADADARRREANGTGSYGGNGGGHDGELAAAVLTMVLQGMTREQCYAGWCKIAIPRDPGWPFTADDFERHLRGALKKAAEIRGQEMQLVTPQSIGWAQGTLQPAPPAAVQQPAGPGNPYPPPTEPMAVARRVVDDRYVRPDRTWSLIWWKGDFYSHTGTHWGSVADPEIEGDLYKHLEHAVYLGTPDKNGARPPVKWAPTKDKISNLTDALAKGVVQFRYPGDPPCWMGTQYDTDLLPVASGLLHRPTRTLYPHNPHFFTTWSLPYDYDSNAPEPQRWHDFMASLWPDDNESPALLQEWFGYVLSGDTRLQKIFLMYGPKRSGKGTVARVLSALTGPQNTTSPTLGSLRETFGLEPLIGKPLIVIPDARLKPNDAAVVAERLLSISGEDSLSVARKYKGVWEGKLPGRITMLSNDLPRFNDMSGALPSRFITLVFGQSFYGREDVHLTESLLTELPGILNWSLDGMDRLRRNGRFTITSSAEETMKTMERLSSPAQAFIEDCCDTGPALASWPAEIFAAWEAWCQREGRIHPGTAETLGRDLRSALPGLSVVRHRRESDGKQERWYQGIALKRI